MNVKITIDDVTPHLKSSTKVLDKFFKIMEIFTDANFVLFIPCAYHRVSGNNRTEVPLYLTQNEKFCKEILSLPSNFQLGYHGYFHGVKGVCNNDEFKEISFEESNVKFELMKKEIEQSGLLDRFVNIFRPPAWRMSKGAIESAYKNGMSLSLSLFRTYDVSVLDKSRTYFYTHNPPFIPLGYGKDIEIVYHACEWDKNYFSDQMKTELISFLTNIKNKEDVIFSKY